MGSTRLDCDDNGVTSFNHVRYRHHDETIFLYAFDLIELNGDLRPDPLESRKATLEMILAKAGPGIRFNEHIEGDRPTVFAHACKLGLEGIVSKRKDSPYRSGRSPRFLREAPYVRTRQDWSADQRPDPPACGEVWPVDSRWCPLSRSVRLRILR